MMVHTQDCTGTDMVRTKSLDPWLFTFHDILVLFITQENEHHRNWVDDAGAAKQQ